MAELLVSLNSAPQHSGHLLSQSLHWEWQSCHLLQKSYWVKWKNDFAQSVFYWILLDCPINLYSSWTNPVCQRAKPKPADNELTTKSQLLSSNRVIASAMLSIPVQACKRKKRKKRELQDKCIVWDYSQKYSNLSAHKKNTFHNKRVEKEWKQQKNMNYYAITHNGNILSREVFTTRAKPNAFLNSIKGLQYCRVGQDTDSNNSFNLWFILLYSS